MMSQAARKAQFFHQLATLLDSGMGVIKSAAHLTQQRGSALQSMAQGLARGVNEGLPLGDALEKYGGQASDVLDFTILRAAERGGRLEDGARYLSRYYDLLARLSAQVKSAMVYPLIVLHAAILLPSVTLFLGENGPAWGAILQPLFIAYGIIAGLYFLGRWLHKGAASSEGMDRLLRMIPFVGVLRENLALARFCQVLRIHLLTGGSVAEGVKSAGVAAGTARLKQESRVWAQRIIDEGNPLGPMLLKSKAFPQELAQNLRTAEAVGRLDEEADRQSELLMLHAGQAASQAGVWIPRLLYVPIAAYAIYRIVSFYTGYMRSITDLL